MEADREGDEPPRVFPRRGVGDGGEAVLPTQLISRQVQIEPPLMAQAKAPDPAVMGHFQPQSPLRLLALGAHRRIGADQPGTQGAGLQSPHGRAAGQVAKGGGGGRIGQTQGLRPHGVRRPAAVGDGPSAGNQHLQGQRLGAGRDAPGTRRRRGGVSHQLQAAALQALIAVAGGGQGAAGVVLAGPGRGHQGRAQGLAALEDRQGAIGQGEESHGPHQAVDGPHHLIRRRDPPLNQGLVQGLQVEQQLNGRLG